SGEVISAPARRQAGEMVAVLAFCKHALDADVNRVGVARTVPVIGGGPSAFFDQRPCLLHPAGAVLARQSGDVGFISWTVKPPAGDDMLGDISDSDGHARAR